MTEELRQKLLHSAEGPGAEPFSQYNHMKVTAVDDGTATVELELHPDSLNCWGTPHGGALFTMADVAAGMALLTRRQEVTFTVSSSIESLSAVVEAAMAMKLHSCSEAMPRWWAISWAMVLGR